MGLSDFQTLFFWSGREDCPCPALLTDRVLETASYHLPSLPSQYSNGRVPEGNQATLISGPSSCLGVARYNKESPGEKNRISEQQYTCIYLCWKSICHSPEIQLSLERCILDHCIWKPYCVHLSSTGCNEAITYAMFLLREQIELLLLWAPPGAREDGDVFSKQGALLGLSLTDSIVYTFS